MNRKRSKSRIDCTMPMMQHASYLGEVSREDFARRYGAFLGFLQRTGKLDLEAGPAAKVTAANVEDDITELQ